MGNTVEMAGGDIYCQNHMPFQPQTYLYFNLNVRYSDPPTQAPLLHDISGNFS